MIQVRVRIRKFVGIPDRGFAWRDTTNTIITIPSDARGLKDKLMVYGVPESVAQAAETKVSCGDWFYGKIEEKPNGESPTLSVTW